MPSNNLSNTYQKIVVIVGPTASGKSNLALRLAKLAQGKAFRKYGINGAEIISADSRQVYRRMDIGTGKVTKKEQEIIRHHLIDVALPRKQFTAFDFEKLAKKALSDVAKRSKLPIIVGGTGFYIDILLGRMALAEIPPNKKLRAKLEKLGIEKLYAKLKKLDPQRSKTIDRYNKRRLVRALEISYELKTTSLQPIAYGLRPITYDVLWLGINPGKEKLDKNIKNRLEKRLGQGMVREVEELHKQGVSWKKLDDFGLEYRWISKYLRYSKFKNSKIQRFKDSEEYQSLLRDIVRYSKRQMTWFKRNKEIHWLNPPTGELKKAKKIVSTFLQKTAH